MSSISIRIDTKDKSMFEDFCEGVGMNVTTAFNMFVKNVISNQKLPFKVERDPFYSKSNQKALLKSIKELKAGKGKVHELIDDK